MESIKSKLLSMQDTAYRDFNAKLIPTVDPKLMIGIRTPLLRKFAKDLFKTEPNQAAAFMQTLPHRYFEENNLHAFLIENIKDFDTAIAETERFLPFIDNWATCDSFAPRLFKKYPDEVYQKILIWIRSPRTYLDELFKPEMLDLVASVRSDEYYINMMIAWYFSFALIKQYDAALPYIKKQTLVPFTHNKTIQKAIESRRIFPEIKDYLRTLKV